MVKNPVDWEESYVIRSYEVGFQNRLRLSTLFNMMQETASNHVTRCGVGLKELKTRNEVWVLSRLMLAMDFYPGWGDEIRIKTWPRGIDRLFALREFQISSPQGEVLGRATSNWLLLDLSTRRPKRPETVFKHMPVAPEQRALDRNLGKLSRLADPEEEKIVEAAYGQIDLNQHVNNAQYIGWIEDVFPFSVYRDRHLSLLQINFLAETRFGEKISLCQKKIEEKEALIYGLEGQKNGGQTLAFQARLEWSKTPI